MWGRAWTDNRCHCVYESVWQANIIVCSFSLIRGSLVIIQRTKICAGCGGQFGMQYLQ